MTLYSVRDWNNLYENNRSRDLIVMKWVPIPTKQDGDGYTDLVSMQDGAGLYGCWIGIVVVAAKCKPRGTLIRETGEPHTAQSIARMSHLPAGLLARALFACVAVKWLDAVPYEIPHEGAVKLQPTAVPVIPFPSLPFSEGDSPKGGEPPAEPEIKQLPAHLNTARMQNKWGVWMNVRRGMKKPRSWLTLFNEQIEWISKFTEAEAFEVLSASIRNGWQGLFDPKESYGNRSNRSSPRENPRNYGIVKGPTDYAAAARRKAGIGEKAPMAGPGDPPEGAPPATGGA